MNMLSQTPSNKAAHLYPRLIRSAITVICLLLILSVTACQPIQPSQAEQTEGGAAPTPVNAPVRLTLPALNLEIPVEAMGWRIAEINGVRTTEWIVPDAAAGWHRNSAGVGDAGNMILSGHQAAGEAVFAPIAIGEVTPGQEIIVTGANGEQARYRIVEVSPPLPLDGASQQQQEQASGYMAQGVAPRLTLITGWPTFTTSHRVFVVAEPVSE